MCMLTEIENSEPCISHSGTMTLQEKLVDRRATFKTSKLRPYSIRYTRGEPHPAIIHVMYVGALCFRLQNERHRGTVRIEPRNGKAQ